MGVIISSHLHPIPFDRTYEGLKHEKWRAIWREARTFDRTYEGLKLPVALLVDLPHLLLTVPMRV